MLQQTQVATVIGYYERFLRRFPDVHTLARAPREDVMQAWAGLGYYARARQAHACAQTIVSAHGGRFPGSAEELERLPGIGASTAAAIAAFCFDERAAILDANVRRVLVRRDAIDTDPRRAPAVQRLWERARALLPGAGQMAAYTQAIMDLGATVCTRTNPHCAACPVTRGCLAHAQGRAGQLPLRTPRAARPVRSAQVLVALHRRAVLVEERPAGGIWGGMLALPEFAQPAQMARAARALSGPGSGPRPQPLAERRHGFTHFTLVFTPHLLRLEQRPAAQAAGQRWLALKHIDTAALPAPLLALLREVREAA
jgi:A/G-specific adenine glycosylase